MQEIEVKKRRKMQFLWKIQKILTATLIRKTALDAVLIDGDGIGIYADGTTCRLTIGVIAKKKILLHSAWATPAFSAYRAGRWLLWQ